jgi:hypothetical protein
MNPADLADRPFPRAFLSRSGPRRGGRAVASANVDDADLDATGATKETA